MDPTDADIHVYESHPSSPKRTLALLPPPPEDKGVILSLGTLENSMVHKNASGLPSLSSPMQVDNVADPSEEGTPEDIRRRFFPSEARPEDNPALTWMLPSATSSSKSELPADGDHSTTKQLGDRSPIQARYSLSGLRLSPTEIRTLPTHLGLHHHASSSSSIDTPAGYTLSDLFLLARSSVPAQRASVLGVLAKILRVLREDEAKREVHSEALTSEGQVDVEAMRKDVLDAAIDALGEKGGVGQRAVDLLWEAVVAFIYTDFDIADLNELPCVDLTPVPPSQPPSTSPLPMRGERVMTRFSQHSSVILMTLPVTRILPALRFHLVTSPSPVSLTHSRVLDILLVLSHFSSHARTIVASDTGLIAAMMDPHLQSSVDSDFEGGQSHATPTSIRILQVLARSGREVAATLTGTADVLLRYVTTPLPTLDLVQWESFCRPPSLRLLTETLKFYSVLARYGIYSNVATIAQDEFARLEKWLLATFRVVAEPAIASLSRAYLDLLEALIVCSTDPHKTTPSHDILWSQVRGWGWIDWTLDFMDALAATSRPVISLSSVDCDVWQESDDQLLWTSIFHTLAAWLESASLNGIKRGEEDRTVVSTRIRPFFRSGCSAKSMVLSAGTKLQNWRFPSSSGIPLMKALHDLANAASLVAAVTRLALTCLQPGGEHSFDFPGQVVHDICIRFLESGATQDLFLLISECHDTMAMPEDAHTFVRPLSSLLSLELQLWHRSMASSMNTVAMDGHREWATQALCVLHALLPGDEHYAKWIFETLCDGVDSSFVKEVFSSINLPDEQWNNGGMKILNPFLIHPLRATIGTGLQDHACREAAYIAPSSPTPESIARSTTLLVPSLSHLRYSWKLYDQGLVLPIRSDWPTWPLNHLLRSGSSHVFQELPPSWDATELDIVRASLLLARIVQELYGRRISRVAASFKMSRAETTLACMKVFMLEHEQQQLDSGEEVFRDPLVTHWMDELLAPFAYGNSPGMHPSIPASTERGSTLEHVSKSFLSTPFYQFYTDFLALYDAISFAHPLFGRLLLSPISMSYAIDYRKLFFGDYGHVMRIIKTGVGDLLCEDVREYLWPVEQDLRMLGWYIQALILSPGSDFIRWMAVHHVASSIWPDLGEKGTDHSERAGKLLSALVRQTSFDVIQDVALYRQLKDEVWLPPKCYKQMNRDCARQRLDFVERMSDRRVKEQVQRLFINEDVM